MPLLGIGAVDLIGFLVALAAILAVGALWVFFQPLVGILNSVPIPFVKLGDAISSGLEFAMKGIILAYDAISHDVAHFLWTYGVGIWHVVYNLVRGVTQALGLANQAVSAAGAVAAQLPVDISGAISSANSYADGVLSTAEQAAAGLFDQAITREDALYNDAIGAVQTAEADAIGVAQGLYNTAIATSEDLYNTAIAHADGLFNTATIDAENLYNQSVATAEGLFDTSITHADDLYNSAIADLESTVAGLGVGAIAAEIAGVIPRVATLEAEAAECLEPLCETVTPNAPSLGRIGQFLTNLETLGIDAFIIALATEAVTDPQAVVTDVTSVVNDVGGPIMTGFRDLIGV